VLWDAGLDRYVLEGSFATASHSAPFSMFLAIDLGELYNYTDIESIAIEYKLAKSSAWTNTWGLFPFGTHSGGIGWQEPSGGNNFIIVNKTAGATWTTVEIGQTQLSGMTNAGIKAGLMPSLVFMGEMTWTNGATFADIGYTILISSITVTLK